MKVLYIIFLVASIASASKFLDQIWQTWKERHGKNYQSYEEELERKTNWANNVKFIEDFNKEGHEYHLHINHFADMSHDEYKASLLENINTTLLMEGAKSIYKSSNRCSDDCLSLDWRNEGFTTEMADQGICKSSWAFSTSGTIDGQLFVMTGNLMETSTQQLLDCSFSWGNRGCHGGVPSWTYRYIEEASGICEAQNYPYLGYTWYCGERFCSKPFTCTGFALVDTGNEQDLLNAVTEVGPISVVVDAAPVTFEYYSRGVYFDTTCRSNSLNHAMLLVGYGIDEDSGYEYWLLKNSWGNNWGIDGYMQMARNWNNLCGIATVASYPILKQT